MAKFPSTNLAQSSDPKDIQKADLDLLDKINQVQSAIDATNAAIAKLNIPSIGGLAPLPQSGAGVGQFYSNMFGSGAAAVLPPGGTWVYWEIQTIAGSVNIYGGSLAAGGTTVGAATGGAIWQLWAWRIA
jgi:hypothetical protein